MATLKIRHLVARPRGDGGTRWYWQPAAPLRLAGWRNVRLPDDQAAAIAEAERLNVQVDAWRAGQADAGPAAPKKPRRRMPAPGSVDALIEAYERSRFWKSLRPTTQKTYRQSLDIISAWAGDLPARAITPVSVQTFYDELRTRTVIRDGRKVVVETPTKAASAIRVLRLLLQVGVRLGHVDRNAAEKPGLVTPESKARIWPATAVSSLVAAADRLGWHSMGTAVLLNEWCGQRQSDVLAWAMPTITDGWLTVRQSKTGAEVALPVQLVPHLVARIEAERVRRAARKVRKLATGDTPDVMLICETTGSPWKGDHFRHVFDDVRAAAVAGDAETTTLPCPEAAGLWFMWLRHTAVTRLAEAGCSTPEIASITGHELTSVELILKRYLVRTKKLAANAFRKRLAAERNETSS